MIRKITCYRRKLKLIKSIIQQKPKQRSEINEKSTLKFKLPEKYCNKPVLVFIGLADCPH